MVKFFGAILILISVMPYINEVIDGVSSYLNSTQLVLAGFLGIFVLLATFKILWSDDSKGYYATG